MSDRRKRAAPAPAAEEPAPMGIGRRSTRGQGPAELQVPEFTNAATTTTASSADAGPALALHTATGAPAKRARTGEHRAAEPRASSRSRRSQDGGDDAAINEESKEEPAAENAAASDPSRRGSVVDLTGSGGGGGGGGSSSRPARSARLISMPATSASPSRRRTRGGGMDEQAQQPQQESPNKRGSRNAKRISHANHDSGSDLSETHASAAAATAHSFRDRSTRGGKPSELEENNLHERAKEMGLSVEELRQVQTGETRGRAATRRSGAANAAPASSAAAAAAADDDEESMGNHHRRSSRRRNIRDEEEEEAFSPESGGEDDEEASEAEEEEEETYNGRPRRHVTKPTTYAEEQAREEEGRRRSGRNHRHESDEERQEEGVQTGYLRTIVAKTHMLSDGRVVSDREYRGMLRHGDPIRLLEPGETPHPIGEDPRLQAVAPSSLRRSASDRGSSAHQADVRRSSRPRQQVQHFTAGKPDSGDESPERYVRPQAGRARAGGKSRRAGRSNRHSRRPVSYGDSSSPSSSSSSSSDSDSSHRHKRHRGGHKRDSNGIQPLHLQIQHQMRRMEAEAGKAGASASSSLPPKSKDGRLADIDPIEIDSGTDWSSIGGLDAHVASLKEMVVLPLLYPELFSNFHLQPPRGVLFYGPPGTGKTLVARALANTCNSTGQRVSFFMRKGADCLSKWVGEAERQLRLLFETAHKMAPSVIFFDELDGLAPVRSSRQDQIHASIVSTLLALMDGLDNRGQVIVIGATNRVDSIDPALRRPGRFDRELMFSLPNKHARRQILQIHTRSWQPPMSAEFLNSVADRCVGYCGADLKALCTEATLRAVRRKYPQIYLSVEKLQIDVAAIALKQVDFIEAMRGIVPAAQRSTQVWARSIPAHLAPLLQPALDQMIDLVRNIFPLGALNKSAQAQLSNVIEDSDDEQQHQHADENMLPASAPHGSPAGLTVDVAPTSFPLHTPAEAVSSIAPATVSAAAAAAVVPRRLLASLPPRPSLPLPLHPRFLVHGACSDLGQGHLGPALLHHFEEFSTYSLDLPMLLGDASARNAEESAVRIIQEAKRNAPSILFWPHLDLWWSTSSESLQNTVLMLLSDLPPNSCVFLFATADCLHSQLPEPLLSLFPMEAKEARSASAASSNSSSATAAAVSSMNSALAFELHRPSADQLASFFRPIVDELKREIPRMRQIAHMEQLPVLPRAVDAPVAAAAAAGALSVSSLTPEQQVAAESLLSASQLSHKLAHEASLLRLQRMSLRGLLQKLMHSFPDFVHRLSHEDYPDYVTTVPEVIALEDLMQSINEDESFDSVSKFNLKIDMVVSNTKEYSTHHGGKYRSWVNKACHLQDTALSMIAQMDTTLVQQCEIISARRAIRKAKLQAAAAAAGNSAAAAAAPVRTNLRSQAKASDESAAAASSSAMLDAPASSAASTSAAVPAAAPVAANVSDAPTKMELDDETDGAEESKVKEEPESTAMAAAASSAAASGSTVPAAGASPTPTAASVPSTLPVSSSPVAPAAAASAAASPSPSPISILLPMPPPLVLDQARLSALPSRLSSLVRGCSVSAAEQIGFQLMKIVVAYQMKPQRNEAMDRIEAIAQDNQTEQAQRN